jgi:hypothetical protein
MPKIMPTSAVTNPAKKTDKNRAGIGPHPHKGGMAQGNLAGEAGQKIQAVAGDNGDTHFDHRGNHVLGAKKGKQHTGDQKGDQPDSDKPGLKDTLIRAVIFVI